MVTPVECRATVSFYQVPKRVFWLYMLYSSKREEAESVMGLIYIYIQISIIYTTSK